MVTGSRRHTVSMLYPSQPAHADHVVPFARAALEVGARRLWMGQSMVAESHQVFAYLAGMGLRISVGIGVTLVPLRHPYEAALQARSLALLTGRPVVVGYGAATPELVAALCGAPYRRPAAAAAGYAGAVRRLVGGATGRSRAELPPVAHPAVEVGLGVLRPGMAEAAGAVADVAITWMTPPTYVRDVLAPALDRGAAGRDRAPRIATVVHVAVARPGRDPYALATVAAGAHLSAPHYTDMLRRAGIPADPADPAAGVRALVDSGGYAYGTPEEIARVITDYGNAGVDEVILNIVGVQATEGTAAALRDLTEITAAWRDHSGRLRIDGSPLTEGIRQ